MRPIQGFQAAIKRAQHFIVLYDLLRDTRERGVRSDWASSFKDLVHWPDAERIVRIDGKDGNSMLILREATGLDRKNFAHDYLSELLRAAIASAVAALDRYMHDLIVDRCIKLLNRPEDDVPKELRKLAIPVLETKKALRQLRADRRARPGHIVKQAIQEVLHRDFTFQKPDDVKRGADMLGIQDFWTKVASAMPGAPTKERVIKRLREICLRRNQIVHEADLVRKVKARRPTLRNVTRQDVEEIVNWINDYVAAIDGCIS